MRAKGFLVLAALVTGQCGSVIAQNAPADMPPDAQSQQQMPQDVPPQFLRPQNEPSQNAPAQNAPATPSTAAPQNGSSDGANAMSGTWEFSNADHDRICHFTFSTEAAAGGYKLDVDKNCPNLFPSTANMVGWSLDNYGDLRLLDADGKEVVELSEVEGGMYDGFTPEEGRYILQTAASAPTLTAADMVGDWAVARGGGKPICVLTLTNTPAGDALALTVKPGCDPFVTAFAPSAWRVDEGALVLYSAHGRNWQFEQNDAKSWQRVPAAANPVLLLRQ